jgi:hypothetical protein
MAYGVMDNGFLNFNKVHIPRENMLMKYSQVCTVMYINGSASIKGTVQTGRTFFLYTDSPILSVY